MDTKLILKIPNRFRFRRVMRWGLSITFAIGWLAFPLTGEPFFRFYRLLTVRGPQCATCFRRAVGKVLYGISGSESSTDVEYCAVHLADPPQGITRGPLGQGNGTFTFFWLLASLLLGIGLA